MYRVGVTGGIGSGKSVVCRMLGILGVPVFEADAEGRRLLAEDKAVQQEVVEQFGEGILVDGRIDRARLAEQVFHDPKALSRLNGIIHPRVRSGFNAWAEGQSATYVVIEAALLVGTEGASQVDHLVVVSAPEEIRIRRVVQRDGVSAEAVKARMRNQVSEAERVEAADTVLHNDDEQMLIPQVLAMHQMLLANSGT